MSDLDDAVNFYVSEMRGTASIDNALAACAELAAIRARLAELEKPKTCMTCRWCVDEYCKNTNGIIGRIGGAVASFGCIHHEHVK